MALNISHDVISVPSVTSEVFEIATYLGLLPHCDREPSSSTICQSFVAPAKSPLEDSLSSSSAVCAIWIHPKALWTGTLDMSWLCMTESWEGVTLVNSESYYAASLKVDHWCHHMLLGGLLYASFAQRDHRATYQYCWMVFRALASIVFVPPPGHFCR